LEFRLNVRFRISRAAEGEPISVMGNDAQTCDFNFIGAWAHDAIAAIRPLTLLDSAS
jgi:hypothetical protein